MLLIARFYLKKRPQDALQDMFMEPSAQEASLYDEESLVAWTALPLVLCANNGEWLNNNNKNLGYELSNFVLWD